MLTDEGVEALRPERGVDAVLHALHRLHQTPLAVPGRRVAHWLSSLSAAGMSASRSCGASSRRATAATAPKASARPYPRSAEHTSELQSLMRISYSSLCLKK